MKPTTLCLLSPCWRQINDHNDNERTRDEKENWNSCRGHVHSRDWSEPNWLSLAFGVLIESNHSTWICMIISVDLLCSTNFECVYQCLLVDSFASSLWIPSRDTPNRFVCHDSHSTWQHVIKMCNCSFSQWCKYIIFPNIAYKMINLEKSSKKVKLVSKSNGSEILFLVGIVCSLLPALFVLRKRNNSNSIFPLDATLGRCNSYCRKISSSIQ